jgi:3-methyladenine DNA glycosylase AlkD
MSTVNQVMTQLKKLGCEQTRSTYLRHGAPESMFGVKVADMKMIVKQIRGDQDLALCLYETGNVDAQYLAGLVADGSQMTRKQLETWCRTTGWGMVNEYTVPWVTSESPHARDLAMKWIGSKKESVASCGWNTYSSMISIRSDDELDIKEIRGLLKQVVAEIDGAQNRVRYTMNGFVISVGVYVGPCLKAAKAAAKKLGKVSVNVGDTACKVPLATEYIEKCESAGRLGKKRKTAKC